MLRGKRQIAKLLQEFIDNRCLISAHTGGGHSFMTAVLRVDEDNERIVLDASPDADANRRALAAERVQCVTRAGSHPHPVRACRTVECPGKSHPALSAPIPKEMLRLQRREFFRLKVPLAHEVSCVLAAEDLARKPVQVSARVIDIGGGGIAVTVAPDRGRIGDRQLAARVPAEPARRRPDRTDTAKCADITPRPSATA